MITDKIKLYFYLGGLYTIISVLLRIIFIWHPITDSEFSSGEIIRIFSVGLINDFFVFILASVFLVLYTLFLSNSKYQKPCGNIIFALMVLFLLYVAFIPNNIFKQYGGSVLEIVLAFLGIKTICFGLMLFFPRRRNLMRSINYFIVLFLYVLLIIFNATSEYFFWNEFGVRYNFIAVDYLIYTNEVIGNILESYPVLPLFSVILTLSIIITIFIFKRTKKELLNLPNLKQKVSLLFVFSLMCCASLYFLPKLSNYTSKNTFTFELQSNGLERFTYAFTNSELDYFKFYPTLPIKKAEQIFLSNYNPSTLERAIVSNHPEIKKNVVLISIESFSASFLKLYGNEDNITPFIDSLANKSLMFTNIYATGNRTVRGLEALTLSIPPTPGESIVKRLDNKNKFTVGNVFKNKGYDIKYLYGGFSYFDNMKDFFDGNDYKIIDRDQFLPKEISFANVWGVCDEDMAKKAIDVMNKEAKSGKPFFSHWMTVSNHRPFTYPEDKIDIPANSKSRNGGVKYTDYSLKKFFEMAKKQDWYKNTVFVIVADHCASSAGKTELPLDKYRIPAMVFSEGFIPAQQFSGLMSQIDLMPTVFGLLNFTYQSKFLGQDVFSDSYVPRAFIATYQDLGYIKDNQLTVISTGKKIKQYNLEQLPSDLPKYFNIYYKQNIKKDLDKDLVNQTISAYEATAYWLKTKQLDK